VKGQGRREEGGCLTLRAARHVVVLSGKLHTSHRQRDREEIKNLWAIKKVHHCVCEDDATTES
jgi:hypothetical protein